MIKTLKLTIFIFSLGILVYSCKRDNIRTAPDQTNSIENSFQDETPSIVENFESGTKTTYAPANVVLLGGSWSFNDALIGVSASDKMGTKAAKIKNTGVISMNYDVNNGISAVLIDYSKDSAEANTAFELWLSNDKGINWSKIGNPINVSSSTQNHVDFYMDYHGEVRIQIRKLNGGILNIDELTVQYNLSTATRDNNMALGNPSGAKADPNSPNNFLMVKPQYALAYNSSKGIPMWVSWHLSAAWKGNAPRVDAFRGDETIPKGLYKTTAANYDNTGFDRGHQCPSDDRDGNSADNFATFYMTDMIPQAPNLNRVTWLALEAYCRTLAGNGNELYIISGGYGQGGTGAKGGSTTTFANGKVEVPSRCWKIIVVLPVGSNDKTRITANTRVIAVDMPNLQTVSSQNWGNYRVKVDAIETITGYDFLSIVSKPIQNSIESVIDTGPTQ